MNLTHRRPGKRTTDADTLRNTFNQGLDRDAFQRLRDAMGVSSEELGTVIRVPQRTLARRKEFKPDESERLFRVASTFQFAIDVTGDLDEARKWFTRPKLALGQRTPLQYCDTEIGAREVENLLGRLEHGVFN